MSLEGVELKKNGAEPAHIRSRPQRARAISKRRKLKPDTLTRHRKALFLKNYAQGGVVTTAAEASGIDRRTVYTWIDVDPAFKLAFEEATSESVDRLEAEARRRAFEGYDVPVYQKGMEVGSIREYSDTLMCLLLKGRRPEVFKDRVDVEGRVRMGPLIDPKTSTNDELEARLLQAAEQLRAKLEARQSPGAALPPISIVPVQVED